MSLCSYILGPPIVFWLHNESCGQIIFKKTNRWEINGEAGPGIDPAVTAQSLQVLTRLRCALIAQEYNRLCTKLWKAVHKTVQWCAHKVLTGLCTYSRRVHCVQNCAQYCAKQWTRLCRALHSVHSTQSSDQTALCTRLCNRLSKTALDCAHCTQSFKQTTQCTMYIRLTCTMQIYRNATH